MHKHLLSVLTLTVFSLSAFHAQAEESEYSFKIHNMTKTVIKQLLVSEDGKEWGNFDIGKGVPPGTSSTMVWDASTNNEDCKQQVKAVYADDTESEPAMFDFCEKDLELEFK